MEWTTSDLADEHGASARVLPPGLRHFGGRRRFTGEVLTVDCFEDNSHVRELVATPGLGRVLVVDGGGSTRCALVGDILAGMALEHGWAGIVLNAAVRDAATLAHLDIGVMAIATSPRRSAKEGQGRVGVALELLGVPVGVGDTLYADEDGIVLLASAPS